LKDADLLSFSIGFRTSIAASPESLGLVQSDVVGFGVVQDLYASAYRTSLDPTTRTKITVEQKRAARAALEASARSLINRIEVMPTVTDEQKLSLGLNVPKPGTPIQPPEETPIMVVTHVMNRTVGIKLKQPERGRCGRPRHCAGARIYSYIGEEPMPADINEWQHQKSTSRATLEINFPATVPPGTRVFFAAAWFSPRQASGPMSDPISTYLGGGVVNKAA